MPSRAREFSSVFAAAAIASAVSAQPAENDPVLWGDLRIAGHVLWDTDSSLYPDFAIIGNELVINVITQNRSTLQFYDLSDISNPALSDSIPLDFGCREFELEGDNLYATAFSPASSDYVFRYDISDRQNPVPINAAPAGFHDNLAVEGGWAFFLDAEDAAIPVFADLRTGTGFDIPTIVYYWQYWNDWIRVDAEGEYAFILSAGILIIHRIDRTGNALPELVAEIPFPGSSAWSLAAFETQAAVAIGARVYFVDFSDISQPTIYADVYANSSRDIELDRGVAFVNDRTANLGEIDIWKVSPTFGTQHVGAINAPDIVRIESRGRYLFVMGNIEGAPDNAAVTIFELGDDIRCPADLASPWLVLDLADLAAFVSAFLDQQPPADMNADGILDLADISSFVDSFLRGCGSPE